MQSPLGFFTVIGWPLARRLRLKSAGLWLVAGVLIQGYASAHHSYAVYDLTKKISVMGTVTKIMWVNPHAYFIVDAKGEDGSVTTWEFLLPSPNEMGRMGWDRKTLKPGDVVTVEASPAKGRATRAMASFATLTDGRKVLVTDEKY